MLNLACHLWPKGSFRRILVQFSRNNSYTSPSKLKTAHHTIAVRRVINLIPERLQVYDFINFSNVTTPIIRWKVGERTVNIRFHYGVIDHVRQPFPARTRGYLYWHHDPRLPITTSEIRFRIMRGNNPEYFPYGTDLIGLSGLPWSVKLLRIARDEKRWGIQRFIVQSKLIERDVFKQMLHAFYSEYTASERTRADLYYLEQPFVLELDKDTCYLRIVTPNVIRYFDFQNPFFDTKTSRSAYTGRIIVNFESQTLPGHGSPSIVLRVSKILEPPRAIFPSDIQHPRPRARCLLEHSVNDGGFCPRTFKVPDHELLPSLTRSAC